MSEPSAGRGPREGDYVVVYGGTRLEIVRVQSDGARALVRATFESSVAAGPRFEAEAAQRALAAGAAAYRQDADGGLVALLDPAEQPPAVPRRSD